MKEVLFSYYQASYFSPFYKTLLNHFFSSSQGMENAL
jgi:hypothetical protein